MIRSARYVHTNLIARDWRRLAAFYIDVFGCKVIPPERDLAGDTTERLTGIPGVHIHGTHLLLPGHGPEGPTLEVFSYHPAQEGPTPSINQLGLAHLAFHVANVPEALAQVVAQGGGTLGEVVTIPIRGAGQVTVVYARDPEGNIIELQQWDQADSTAAP